MERSQPWQQTCSHPKTSDSSNEHRNQPVDIYYGRFMKITTAYDAAYVELAERLQAKLVSLDADIIKLKKLYRWIV